MLVDTIHGIIERRVLLNYRIAPEALVAVLPAPFRPKLYRGWAVGGICMIRFRGLRPLGVPTQFGIDSENAAHRFAVEWDQDGVQKEGVYIPRRDTNSGFNKLLGGLLFPGIFQRSVFESRDTGRSASVRVVRDDGSEEFAFAGEDAASLPNDSIFPSLGEAAGFFSLGATGYSATRRPGHYHGMELRFLDWTIAPLLINEARSRFFSDIRYFPDGSLSLDSALVMRNIPHEWHSRPDLRLSTDGSRLTAQRTKG